MSGPAQDSGQFPFEILEVGCSADALHRAGDEAGSQAALTEAVELFVEITAGNDAVWVPEVWFLTEW